MQIQYLKSIKSIKSFCSSSDARVTFYLIFLSTVSTNKDTLHKFTKPQNLSSGILISKKEENQTEPIHFIIIADYHNFNLTAIPINLVYLVAETNRSRCRFLQFYKKKEKRRKS